EGVTGGGVGGVGGRKGAELGRPGAGRGGRKGSHRGGPAADEGQGRRDAAVGEHLAGAPGRTPAGRETGQQAPTKKESEEGDEPEPAQPPPHGRPDAEGAGHTAPREPGHPPPSASSRAPPST